MRENLNLPLISVIVPVHNGQDYLKNCVDSILAQTYQSLEIIIINDGSSDRTGEICMELDRTYEAISVIEMEDLGVSEGRNAGLERMNGEYVTFVDADDRIHPRMLEILYRNLVQTGSDVSGCRFFSWQTEGEWETGAAQVFQDLNPQRGTCAAAGSERGQDAVRIFSQKMFALEGLLKNDTRCWSKLYKKECMQDVRFRKGLTIGEDMLFLIDLLPHVRRIVSTDFEGYGYFQNPYGAMNRKFNPSYMDQITCWKLAGEGLSAWMAEMEKPDGQRQETFGEAADPTGRLTASEISFVEETVAARLMVGIMLTVGKIAVLPAGERRQNRQYAAVCHHCLKECLAAGKGAAYLDRGYRYKVRLFAVMPDVYVRLYGMLKRF